MKKLKSEPAAEPITGRLWAMSAKLKGLGYLIAHQTPESVPNAEETGYGIGEILREMGHELEDIRECLGEPSPNFLKY